MAEAQNWTTAAAMLLPEILWPCMGVAVRYKDAIKEKPSFERSRMEAYASSADMESEKRHVTCCPSCNKLLHLDMFSVKPIHVTAVSLCFSLIL